MARDKQDWSGVGENFLKDDNTLTDVDADSEHNESDGELNSKSEWQQASNSQRKTTGQHSQSERQPSLREQVATTYFSSEADVSSGDEYYTDGDDDYEDNESDRWSDGLMDFIVSDHESEEEQSDDSPSLTSDVWMSQMPDSTGFIGIRLVKKRGRRIILSSDGESDIEEDMMGASD